MVHVLLNLTWHELHCEGRLHTHTRHNELRDTLANIDNEVCHDVDIVPQLQPLQGKSLADNSTTTEHDYNKANGLWFEKIVQCFSVLLWDVAGSMCFKFFEYSVLCGMYWLKKWQFSSWVYLSQDKFDVAERAVFSTFDLNVSCESNVIPRSLTSDTCSMLKIGGTAFLDFLN